MDRHRRPSGSALSVLAFLAAAPAEWFHGYALGAELHIPSGSLYPILIRLADRGWLETSWSDGVAGKPPRHLYRLTSVGLEQAHVWIASHGKAANLALRPSITGST